MLSATPKASMSRLAAPRLSSAFTASDPTEDVPSEASMAERSPVRHGTCDPSRATSQPSPPRCERDHLPCRKDLPKVTQAQEPRLLNNFADFFRLLSDLHLAQCKGIIMEAQCYLSIRDGSAGMVNLDPGVVKACQ
ncbi:hypothetical protein H1C71_005520 [Ictidomys tridecemlineatus]|nr:hypothetical protein H1C71_005520 [Ictidomys tridecemlineatus]